MTEPDFALVALLLGAACAVAALLGLRLGNEKRDVRLTMGGGAALGGLALLLMSMGGS
ncbi:hypothetical protein [Ramlibacter sp. AN1133]|uniref:hypothetical protein n=1 Tax=Ramlibacter sp. AN1133 TaxID=3133429 RepID=UPI0030BB41E3